VSAIIDSRARSDDSISWWKMRREKEIAYFEMLSGPNPSVRLPLFRFDRGAREGREELIRRWIRN
jgi:hypothetical protein